MNVLVTLFVVHLLAIMTPGPDSLLVARTAVGSSRRAALYMTAGIMAGNVIWAGLAIGGLHLIFERIMWLQTALKLVGGAYLIFLGIQMWRSSLKKASPEQGVGGTSTPISDLTAFRTGFLTNMANVKVVVYYSSIFITFVTPTTSAGLKTAMFILVLLEGTAFFTVVTFLLSLPGPQRAYRRATAWIDRVAGTVFALFGLRLILAAHRQH